MSHAMPTFKYRYEASAVYIVRPGGRAVVCYVLDQIMFYECVYCWLMTKRLNTK